MKLASQLLLFAIFLLYAWPAYGRGDEKINDNNAFYFDAVVFKSDKPGLARVDIFTMTPAMTLKFEKSGDIFGAFYTLNISAFDSSGKMVENKRENGKMIEKDYFASKGGAAMFDYSQTIFELPPGMYKIKALLTDKNAKKEYRRSRTITVLDFDAYPFALSGTMLVSSIEVRDEKYIITPHISDDVGDLSEGFFAFFEAYSLNSPDSVDFVYQILDGDNEVLVQSQKIRKTGFGASKQVYIKIERPQNLKSGKYNLRILALNPSEKEGYTKIDYLAVAQRSIRFDISVSGAVMKDIDLAIRQLRYAAGGDEIDFINDAESEDEKIKRFEDFWKKKDPTPNTIRNEAFDEYYGRVDFTDRNFKSYTQGWLTDKGMVYIILGPPMDINQYSGYGDGRKYEKWIYGNSREYIFVDNSGFGEFRLLRPLSVGEKYKYKF